MKNVLIIAGSTSSASINRQLATYAASKIEEGNVEELKIADLDLPLYDQDYEEASGIPEGAKAFIETVAASDLLIISLAEHNGSYAAAFKNAYDWASRVEYQVWGNKPMLLMTTSPGGRGGQTVLDAAAQTFPRMGADLKATFSLPSFQDHFEDGKITDTDLDAQLTSAVAKLSE